MAKFGYHVNTIRIQRDAYFISGNMQGKYNKQKQPPEVFCKKRRPVTLLKSTLTLWILQNF